MMGPGHSLSGAAVWLGATAGYTLSTGTPVDPAILIMGTAVLSGAALIPDLDSYTATITKSFGIFGRIFYYVANAVSLTLYNLTKTSKDTDITNGHRTFTHTLVFSILAGLGVLGLTSLGGDVNLLGIEYTWGQLAALLVMAFCLHLGTAGLFAPQIKKAKNKLGVFAPLILMIFSLGVTFLISRFLPTDGTTYQWLAILVGAGCLIHVFGDSITKMGTPFLWPIKIRRKRWYDISLPAALRITAGGAVETKILVPIFALVILTGIVIQSLFAFGLL